MAASSLPYDMGNAGDLLKHGWLAEWTAWWCECVSPQLTFLDPFGGRPWIDNPTSEVINRVRELGRTTLNSVQCAGSTRYLGSGHLVRQTAELAGGEAVVLVSDRDRQAQEALVHSGLALLEAPGFDSENSYSIFDAEASGNLLLVDPFAQFLAYHAATVIPKVGQLSEHTSVLLFVLDLDSSNSVGVQYAKLRNKYLARAWVARCPKLQGTAVRGESRHEAEVALVVPRELDQRAQDRLSPRLSDYCRRLSEVLRAEVSFQEPPAKL